ncbi:MAG: GntR family transcriptional regulator [Rhodoferax sp.]|nr:GntR family transcriptional regulator [Rhodoferax sp.]
MTAGTSSLLERDSGTPLWIQLRDILRQQIASGQLGVNAQLPSEADLGEIYGISRIVVRETLADLVRSGLIYKIKGKGAFISTPKRDEDFISMVLGFSDEMAIKGRIVRTQVLGQALRAPDEKEALALSLQTDAQVTSLRRLRSVDGNVRLLVSTVVPTDVAPELHKIRLEDKSLYEVLRRQYGLHVARAERWIDAVLPDADTMALLQLETLEPLLRIESVAFTKEGRAVEHYVALHRCQNTRLHVRTQT